MRSFLVFQSVGPHEPLELRDYLAREGVRELSLLPEDVSIPPLFPTPVQVPAALAQQFSISSYFLPREEDGRWTIGDDHPLNEAYHNRQRMLASVYRAFVDDAAEATLLDVAGSNGYYSFHAARLGFRGVTCIDGRPEHGEQFAALRELAATPAVGFELVDVEDLRPLQGRTFDVVVAQGILYHLYDHMAFLRHAARLATRVLIIDTHIAGGLEPVAKMTEEDRDCSRKSPVTAISLTPSVVTLLALLRAAGCDNLFHMPWPGRIRASDGSPVDKYGYSRMYRIMLVAGIG